MKSELVGLDLLLLTSFFDELLGQLGAFARSHHPADDITTENVEDHVEVKIGPLGRAAKLGDVPAPKLIGGAGQKFRFLILGMDELIAALASCAIFFQHTIHGPSRAKILAFIEQRGVDRGGGAILEAFTIQHGANGFPFVETQGARWNRPSGRCRKRNAQGWPEQRALPIKGSPSDAEHGTGRLDADRRRKLQNSVHYPFPSGSTVEQPNSVATFFRKSTPLRMSEPERCNPDHQDRPAEVKRQRYPSDLSVGHDV